VSEPEHCVEEYRHYAEADGLEGMEADQRNFVVGFEEEEDDRRDDRDVGEGCGEVVRESR
jgi:hypothetical protein